MANHAAIRSVGNSIVGFLESRYPPEIRIDYEASFKLLSSGELASDPELTTALSLYLYRISVSEHLRNVRPRGERSSPLALDLHYLLTAWASSADAEQTLMAWAMRTLHDFPILDSSTLPTDGGWANDEVLHIAPEELSHEDMMRVWDAVAPTYRLSYSYVVRVVLVDSERPDDSERVRATRLEPYELDPNRREPGPT